VAPRTLAYVTPEVLLWARESAGYSVEDAANAIDLSWSELETVEQGYDLLTLRQAEKPRGSSKYNWREHVEP
jgi:hypothetical protein